VLTGDKKETAISIGYSSALLSNEMERVEVTGTLEEEVRTEIEHGLILAKESTHIEISMVISGEALLHITKAGESGLAT
jgi:phospholipid-transporting ATPase